MPKFTIRATHALKSIFRRATKGRFDLPYPNPEELAPPKGPRRDGVEEEQAR